MVEKTVCSSLCVVLPNDVTYAVQSIRRDHDKSFLRWPPHVNLLYPFIPESSISNYVNEISNALHDMIPFKITFSEFKHFRHTQRSFTLWLEPNPREQFIELQRRVQRVFPALTDLSTIEVFGYTPHLSLGQWHSQSSLEAAKNEYSSSWIPFSCVIDSVHIITRSEDKPFSIYYTIPFGGKAPYQGTGSSSSTTPLLRQPSSMATEKTNVSHPVYKWYSDKSKWDRVESLQSSDGISILDSGSVRVTTWNVFHDADDTPRFRDSLRQKSVIEHIHNLSERSDVIVLTEMTRTVLSALLEQEWLRCSFSVSDIGEDSDESPSFVLIVARKPFRELIVQHSRSKRSVIAVFMGKTNFDPQLAVAGVHLTSNFRKSSQDVVAIRIQQLGAVSRALTDIDCMSIITGDFNMADGTSSSTEVRALRSLVPDFVDCWQFIHPHDTGFTFDPASNNTASVTSLSRQPSRYDRILVQPSTDAHCHYLPSSVDIIKPPTFSVSDGDEKEFFVSDHFSLTATIVRHDGPCPPIEQHVTSIDEYISSRPGIIPDDSTNSIATKALKVLQKAISQCGEPRIFVNPTGSYALGAFHVGGDIDLVCVSTDPCESFFERLGIQLIALHCPCYVATGALVPIMRATIRGIEFEIQYCRVPQSLLDSLTQPIRTPDVFLALRKLQLSPSQQQQQQEGAVVWDDAEIRAVSGWAAAQTLNAAIPDSVRSEAIKMIAIVKRWSKSCGIYSAKMGYPGGIGWTVLCIRILQKELAGSSASASSITVEHLISQFFKTYSGIDFKGSSLALIGQSVSSSISRESNAKMAIWTPSKPYFNITRNSTNSSVTCLRSHFTATQSLIQKAGGIDKIDWELFLQQNHHRPLLKSSHTLAVVLVTVSALTKSSYQAWSNFIESRIVGLVIALERVCPSGVIPILFSCPFYNPSPSYPHQCCFLVIMNDISESSAYADMDPIAVSDIFRPPSQEWEHSVLSEKPGDGFISVWSYSTDKMPKWLLADGAINPENSMTKKSDVDADEDDDDMIDVETFKEYLHNSFVARTEASVSVPVQPAVSGKKEKESKTKGKEKKGSKIGSSSTSAASSASVSSQNPAGKLRTSEDVYHRIMWDPSFNKAEYTICYEDRFLGLMEVPFESFDHENIPFHRVWLYKHRGDIVWDREKRIDLVF